MWIVVELSSKGERETPETLQRTLEKLTRNRIEVFIPAKTFQRKQSFVTLWSMEGYVFVQSGLTASEYFDLERHSFFRRILTHDDGNSRVIGFVDQSVVDTQKANLKALGWQNFEVGHIVNIISGVYEGLQGEILALYPEGPEPRAEIQVQGLRSISTSVLLPYMMLDGQLDLDSQSLPFLED